MFRVFNMGIGMILIVSEKDCQEVLEYLSLMNEKAYWIGTIEKRDDKQEAVILEGK
ncbi:MAG TPA: AIR synthase-related protein [Smithella sp.]|nr:AIR synthase-related protein [Smithella sp.]